MQYLDSEFFDRDTLEVAHDLIGTVMVVGRCEGRIVETEAYTTDAASHFVTRRHQAVVMRETFAHIYVFRIYGMHFCLNFTTERANPGAVIIRAVEPTRGLERMMERRGTRDVRLLCSGPGRLCQAFGIDLAFNGLPIGKKLRLRPATGKPAVVARSRRIGISQAVELDWRFYDAHSAMVSGRPAGKPPAAHAGPKRTR
jgi:DNA-3-methyladenine glycosylase